MIDTSGKSILIVDDEIYTVEGIKSCLDWKRIGIERIHTAFNAAQARDILTSYPVDVILCDIEMPQESGLSLLQWVKENSLETKFIILSCHSDFNFAQKAIHLKSFDYLVKPVASSELRQVILQALGVMPVHQVPVPSYRDQLFSCYETEAAETENEENLFSQDVKRWVILLQGGAVEKVRSEVRNWIGKIPLERSRDRVLLEKILLDFQYVLLSILNSRDISPHSLLDTEEKVAQYHDACESTSELLRWIDSALDDAMNTFSNARRSDSYVGRAMEYIEQHLSEEITCEEIAAYVSVNPDYLTRLFKKELGVSTSGFIIQKRIDFAKDLLVNSKFLVGEIAALCGYDNPAHFSCTFKKIVNDTPINFRNTRCAVSAVSG